MAVRKWAPWVVVPALAALVAALLISIAAVGGGESYVGAARDAASYADDYGVSVDEAKRRLGLRAEAGKLGAALTSGEVSTFGGLWIVHTPQYSVKVAFTGDGEATLEGYNMSEALAGVIDVVPVDTTLEALITAQSGAASAVASTGVAAESGVMVQENAVHVFTLDKAALERALDSAGAVLPTKSRVKEVSVLSTPAHGSELHGGEHITGCTSGFAVKNSVGTQGITTAGHCDDEQRRSGTTLTLVKKWDGGSYDLQWHTGPSDQTIRNLVYDGTNHRYINSGRARRDQSAGELCVQVWQDHKVRLRRDREHAL
ncbi:MAG: hypothetical protein OXI54_06655 [Chloroflexota bacterium]|nr:hypothetical protein [Chloroflexota bacterium]MDE2683814.1 hypothetical protein [Chloroflexota bacterium]